MAVDVDARGEISERARRLVDALQRLWPEVARHGFQMKVLASAGDAMLDAAGELPQHVIATGLRGVGCTATGIDLIVRGSMRMDRLMEYTGLDGITPG